MNVKKENLKQRYFSFGVIAVAIAMLAVIFAFSSKNVDTDSYAKKSEPKVIKKVKKLKTSQEAVKEEPKRNRLRQLQSQLQQQSKQHQLQKQLQLFNKKQLKLFNIQQLQ